MVVLLEGNKRYLTEMSAHGYKNTEDKSRM